MSRFAGRRSGGGDSSTLIIIVMMMMMSFVFIIVGGGWFYNKSTDGGIIGVVCNDDKNAEYELDNQLKCKFVKCKDGYTADSTGTCVGGKDTNLSVTSGEENISVDCEIDEITPYTFGQCLNTVTGEPLSGDIDNCGTGRQRKTPNVKTVQIGRESSCPEQTHAECTVACPLECKAPDELWAPDDGAVCMAGTRKLGVTVDVGGGALVTYCGEGTQIKKLDGERITSSMMGGMDLEAYKNSINFNVCTSPTSKPCKVECTNATQPVSCPISNYDIGWLYEGGGTGTVYTKESAEGLLRGDINASQLELEPAVSRQDAIDSGAFVSATGAVNNDLIPKGYKIKFKASNEYSTAWLREQGCSIFVLEEAQAPRTSEACTWTELPGACYDVGCGTLQQKTVDHNIAIQAWGNGSCDKPREFTQSCTARTASCCDERYVGAWTIVDGYKGCVADNGTLKRQSTRPGNAACSNSNEKYENDDNCNYIEGVAKVVLSSSYSIVNDSIHSVPYMLLNYIDSSGTTHNTSRIKNNDTKTFDTPVKLTYVQGGLYYNGSQYNRDGAATEASVLDVNVYDRDNNLLKNFHYEYALGFRTYNVGGHYATDKPGSEDWETPSDRFSLQY
tara:strand:- start:51 stop:1901 length:1851 start_codon:yes stop_codon:yes gene_type:complete